MIFYYYLNSEKAKLILISFSLTGLWDLWTVSPGWTFHPDTPSSSAHSPPHPFLEHDKDTHLSLRHCESEWKKEGRLSGADTNANHKDTIVHFLTRTVAIFRDGGGIWILLLWAGGLVFLLLHLHLLCCGLLLFSVTVHWHVSKIMSHWWGRIKT